MSMNKAAAAVIVGAVAMFAMPSAHAQMAFGDCQNVSMGQRAFCMMEAQAAKRVQEAKEQKKDVTIHYDYDATNDTPAQTKAKQTYKAAAEKCASLMAGQQAFCMEEAENAYNKGMGW